MAWRGGTLRRVTGSAGSKPMPAGPLRTSAKAVSSLACRAKAASNANTRSVISEAGLGRGRTGRSRCTPRRSAPTSWTTHWRGDGAADPQGRQQHKSVLDAFFEDLIGKLLVGQARESCSVPTIMAKTLSVLTRADCGSSGARRAVMSSTMTSAPSA
jgi:hypothetical protein